MLLYFFMIFDEAKFSYETIWTNKMTYARGSTHCYITGIIKTSKKWP